LIEVLDIDPTMYPMVRVLTVKAPSCQRWMDTGYNSEARNIFL